MIWEGIFMGLRLELEQIQGVFAIMPTPALPNVHTVNDEFTVDLEETVRATNALVDSGVNAIMINGTLGESSSLTESEWQQFTKTVLQTANGRIPIIVGPTTLNTRDTIRRARFAYEAGAAGLLLGRPFWCELPSEAVIQFYKDVAEALPEMGIIVYNNPSAFKSKITPEMWTELANIEQVVGSKYGSYNDNYQACLEAVKGKMRFMTMEKDWYKVYSISPEQNIACWSSGASCHPLPVIALREAIQQGNHEEAEYLTKEIKKTYETFFPNNDRDLFRLYTIQVEKSRIDAAGFMKAGPSRRPYHYIPEEYEQGARESGVRWRNLATLLESRALNTQ
jgi:dihydrodipicolinate synthase/N-acetylneuraminate lyase